jgi:opacity protein-like surface antigen
MCIMTKVTKVAAASALVCAIAVGGVTVPSQAADLNVKTYGKAPPLPPPPPLDSWTGLYVGAHLGGDWAAEGISTDPSGVLGGVQIGYDYLFYPRSFWAGAAVVGAELDLSWTSASGTTSVFAPPGTFTSTHNWYDTYTGRIGLVQDNFLYYVKGGVAWMNADYTLAAALGGSINATRNGWTVGAGVEWMFAPRWSAKLEYDYLDFGTNTLVFGAGTTSFQTQVHQLKAGVNYRFAPGVLSGLF